LPPHKITAISGALLDSGTRRLLRSPARVRAFNIARGGLLIASVLPVLFEAW
jgi:threonine/homoserine/homoserine lactone efflux protein